MTAVLDHYMHISPAVILSEFVTTKPQQPGEYNGCYHSIIELLQVAKGCHVNNLL